MINSALLVEIEGQLPLSKILKLTKLVIEVWISAHPVQAIRFDLFKTFVDQAIKQLLLLCQHLRVIILTDPNRSISLTKWPFGTSFKRRELTVYWRQPRLDRLHRQLTMHMHHAIVWFFLADFAGWVAAI